MSFRRPVQILFLASLLNACGQVQPKPAELFSSKPVERESYGEAKDMQLMSEAFAAGTIEGSNGQLKDIAAQGFTLSAGRKMRLSKGLHNVIRALINQGVSIRVMSAGRPGHGQHGEQDPLNPSEYFIAALDIEAVNGSPIDILHPDESIAAITSLVDALPEGTYETGFPRKPYPIDIPDAECYAKIEGADYGSTQNLGSLYSRGKLINADRSAYSTFIDSSYNTVQAYDAVTNPGGCIVKSYKHAKTFVPDASPAKDKRDAVIDEFVAKLGIVTPGVDAVNAVEVRSRVRNSYVSAMDRGVKFHLIYGDSLNHFHLSVYKANASVDTRVFQIGDVNRDGRSDIFVRNHSATSGQKGQNFIWTMNGVNRGKIQTNTVDELDWMMIGYGDFNQDSNTDIFWFNRRTGQKSIWLMQGSTVLSTQEPNGTTGNDMNWVPAGVGDFNGDGASEILWRNKADGSMGIWSWDGFAFYTPSGLLEYMPGLDNYVGGIVDYDKDGISDIIWVNRATGELRVVLMSADPENRLEIYLDLLESPSWSVRAAGNFKGDGKVALLLHNSADGRIALMSGYSMQQFSSLATEYNVEVGSLPTASWRVGGTLE